jgi:ankyrin repeat protein
MSRRRVATLLRSGATVHPRDAQLQTPLWLAARHNHLDVADMLAEFWADVNALWCDDSTSLMAISMLP